MADDWEVLLDESVLNDLRIECTVGRELRQSSLYMAGLRLRVCFQHIACSKHGDASFFTIKEFVSRGDYIFSKLGLKLLDNNEDGVESVVLMKKFRSFDKSDTGKVSLECFVLGILDLLLSFRNDIKDLKSAANNIMLDAKSKSFHISTNNSTIGSAGSEFVTSSSVESVLAAVEKSEIEYLYSYFLIHRLKSLHFKNLRQVHVDDDTSSISETISSEKLICLIQAAVDDSLHSLTQYFRIPSIRMKCLLHEHANGLATVADPSDTVESNVNNFVWSFRAKGEENTISSIFANEITQKGEKQEHPVSNTVQPLDDGALLLLQAAFKSLESFSHVSKDPKRTTGGQRWLPPPSSTVVESEIFDSLSESAVTQQYLATQEALQQTRTRMEVLEILLDKEKQNPKLGKFKSLEPYPLIPPQKVDEDSADSSDKLFENILSEINHLKVSAAERATPSHPLGYLLETNHRQVAVVSTAFADASAIRGDTPQQPGLQSKENEEISSAISNFLEKLQKLAVNVVENATASQRQQQQLANLTSSLHQQEEKLSEFMNMIDQSEVDRNESVYMRVEVQMLRDANFKLRHELDRMNQIQVEYDKLDRHARQLSEQLVEATRQKKAAAASSAANKDDHPAASSSSSSTSVSGKKSSSSEYRDTINQLEGKLSATKGEQVKLEKDNQRLKNSITAAEQRVKDCLHDQMLLHHQIQVLEEEALSSKTTITRLTRELEDRKFLRSGREEKDRKLSELQREVVKLQHDLAAQKLTVLNVTKVQTDLSNAEKTIESLENKLGDLNVEVERGAVALSQLDNYREQIRLKTKENRDLQLHSQGLVTQLKNVPYLQSKLTEMSDELQDYKMRAEKIPGLLAEIARMRGSSRASMKALTDQEKTLAAMKQRINHLEKDNTVLKNENRSLQDTETKLKDALAEIKRLKSVEDEVSSLRAVVQNTVVEKKALEGENKKMRKFMRQSVISPGSSLNGMGASHMNATGGGGANNGAGDAEDLNASSPFPSVPSFDEKL